jgi:putative acetyltransferase
MNITAEQIATEIRRHSRQLVRELTIVNGSYLDTGYTISQCHVMFELSLNTSLNLMELSEALLTDKSNTSRTVKKLVEIGLVNAEKVSTDQRQKRFSLTQRGVKALRGITSLANKQVETALENLSQQQRLRVIDGMQLYASALRNARMQADYAIRPIQKQDNSQVARVIRDVMTEYKAVGSGYSIGDAEVDDMYSHYRDQQSCFYVIVREGEVFGCGGIAPLQGGDQWTCELRKMYCRSEIRGIGLGRRLLMLLLQQARERGFRTCYLETLDRMWRANELYQRSGFKLLAGPLGQTGHRSCDRWYALDLQQPGEES